MQDYEKPFRVKPVAGKGDTPRPVNGDDYRNNYEDIFRKPKQQLEVECPTPNQEEEEESK